eukprot:1154492-Pelagomonas_calceolata.AAC.1
MAKVSRTSARQLHELNIQNHRGLIGMVWLQPRFASAKLPPQAAYGFFGWLRPATTRSAKRPG